ncbi:MAG: hypothetical protein ACUZ9M_01740 [Candidatus Scalindua sp.]
MIPKIDFGFLICSYLPGVPIAVALYVTKLSSIINIDGGKTSTIFLIVAPLICGLFLDAIRHTLGKISCKCMHNKFGWEPLPKESMKENNTDKYQEAFFSSILANTETNYHVYEFFGNSLLSCLFALLLFIFTGTTIAGMSTIYSILVILSILSLIGTWVFAHEQKENINKFFE